jgi:hypothetical protein
MTVSSRWFADAGPARGGFLLPGHPRRRTATLLLRENIVELIGRRWRFGSKLRIELHWRAFGHGWNITMLREGHSVAAEVGGQHPDAEAFFRAFRFEWGFFQSKDAIAVPLLDPINPLMGHAEAEGATLDALCWLLRSRPDARERLADAKRMRRLARDMAAQPLPPKVIPREAPSTTVEILGQLQRLGFIHPVLGRPMPDDELVSRAKSLDASSMLSRPSLRRLRWTSVGHR